jgi:hypothetical protein
MSSLFVHTACHCVFVSQDSAVADQLHLRQKSAFERVSTDLFLPSTHLEIFEHEPFKLDEAIARIKADTTGERRHVLLIGGAYLDECVSLIALEALAEGYDVHHLVDLSMSRIPQLTRVTEYRLFQAGVVPVSLRQLLVQWRAVTADATLTSVLHALLQNYDVAALQQVASDEFKWIQHQNKKGNPPWPAT